MRIGNVSAKLELRRWRRAVGAATLVLMATVLAAARPAPRDLPFDVGERLNYRMSLGAFGDIGRGSMVVEGPQQIRNREAMVLRLFEKFFFETEGARRAAS